LSQGIGRLKKLKDLNLMQNKLINLPCDIGDLTNLEDLIVHGNNLTSLPKEIGEMVALKHISIGDNDLSSLPDEIMNLNNLEYISLENNNFTSEDAKKWTDRFSNTKCIIEFGSQKCNISDPINIENNIRGGRLEDSFSEIYLNSKDGDTVSNIFHKSSLDEGDLSSMLMAKIRYEGIKINEGLNAIDSENNIVPIDILLNAENLSTEDELIQWLKITYIQTCNEYNLKPNPRLYISGERIGGNVKTIEMSEYSSV
jgi:Leucine-rich repeat (LRR) protein